MTSDRLEVHVFGSSIGESIVLKLPCGRFGVVDSYARSLDDPASNPTIAYLRQNEVRELEFLCLTHPHNDHYRGMSGILREFTVRLFIRPSAITKERLVRILQAESVDAARSGIDYKVANASELKALFETVRGQQRSQNHPLNTKHGIVGNILYPREHNSDAPFRIIALAPTESEIEAYEEQVGRVFRNGAVRKGGINLPHNRISLGLLVEFGSTRVVLGGDVEKVNWEEALIQMGNSLPAHLVKVSHHGSSNGYCEKLWEAFSASAKPIAVVTSYSSQSLPQMSALAHIQRHASNIATPCLDEILRKEKKFDSAMKLESAVALQVMLNARPKRNCQFGHCSFSFDANGNCVESSHGEFGGNIPQLS